MKARRQQLIVPESESPFRDRLRSEGSGVFPQTIPDYVAEAYPGRWVLMK